MALLALRSVAFVSNLPLLRPPIDIELLFKYFFIILLEERANVFWGFCILNNDDMPLTFHWICFVTSRLEGSSLSQHTHQYFVRNLNLTINHSYFAFTLHQVHLRRYYCSWIDDLAKWTLVACSFMVRYLFVVRCQHQFLPSLLWHYLYSQIFKKR